jgi:hypothetical protein
MEWHEGGPTSCDGGGRGQRGEEGSRRGGARTVIKVRLYPSLTSSPTLRVDRQL